MLVKEFDYFKNLEKRLLALQKAQVEVGYWAEQGDHVSYDGGAETSYPYLAYIHNEGVGVPSRPFFTIGMFEKPVKTNKVLKKGLKRYFSKIKQSSPQISASQLMAKVAGDYIQTFRGIIGSSQLKSLRDSTVALKTEQGAMSPSSPLVHSGKLQSAMSYKLNNGTIITPNLM